MRQTSIVPVPVYQGDTAQYARELGQWAETFQRAVDADMAWLRGVWDDVRTPATALQSAGAKAGSFVAYKDSVVLEFTDNKDNIAQFAVQLPHSVLEGSMIEAHAHIVPETDGSGTTKWTFTYAPANVGEDLPASAYDITVSYDIEAGQAGKHLLMEIGDLTSFTDHKISAMVLCSLTREAAEAADTYNNASVYLLEMDFHCEKDSNGSKSASEK